MSHSFRVSKWNCCVYFSFLHSISLSLSVPLSLSSPPTTIHCPVQIVHLLTLLFFMPLLLPLPSYGISSSVPVLGKYFLVYSLEHKHKSSNTILCTRNCFFTNSPCCVQSVSFVWTAIYDIQLKRYKPVTYAHKQCGIIRKPAYCYHRIKKFNKPIWH